MGIAGRGIHNILEEQQLTKTATSFCSWVVVAALIVLASAGIAAAQCSNTETCYGTDALNGDQSSEDYNSAFGYDALQANTTGDGNTAAGAEALYLNQTGIRNTAAGFQALGNNTAGSSNTAAGAEALTYNAGEGNTAAGDGALYLNQTGNYNTAAGKQALDANTTGSYNIGVGIEAGSNLTEGSYNIDIGNKGVAGESNTIRIGTQGTQTGTYIAGIFGTSKIKKACQVVVENTGQLGCVKSSARYKRDIRDMGDASNKLMKLRPVIFRYKEDSDGIPQYGLIAEEVEKVYPELVIDNSDGKAETVAYQVLPAMLLNEVQKQSHQLAQKDAQIAALQRQVASQQEQVDALKKKAMQLDALAERMSALERQARLARPEHLASVTH